MLGRSGLANDLDPYIGSLALYIDVKFLKQILDAIIPQGGSIKGTLQSVLDIKLQNRDLINED
jgi:hypothetical protein